MRLPVLPAVLAVLALVPSVAGAAPVIIVRPYVWKDVPSSTFTYSSMASSATMTDKNVSAPTGFANRHDWRVSLDGTTDALVGQDDDFDISATLTLTGDPASPRKEAGLRVDTPVGDGQFIVDTDAHEIVAFGGPFPMYDFRAHGAPDYQPGTPIRLRVQYLSRKGVRGFIYSAGSFTSPFLPAQSRYGAIAPGSTLGGYLQVVNAPSVPTNAGSATFSDIQMQITRPPAPPLISDAVLLDRTEAQACAYASDYLITTPPAPGFPYGRAMLADTSRSGQLCSTAATGMGLVCLAIQAFRYGTSPEWTVTPETARGYANAILDTVLEMQANPATSWNGLPYHYVSPGPTGAFIRWPGSEVSTVDSVLLFEGALAAGQAFGGEVREKALRVAANARWSPFLVTIDGVPRVSMAWRPEREADPNATYGYVIPYGGGYLNTANWDRPTDEILAISILAMGREPDNASLLRAFYDYPRDPHTYKGGNGVYYTVVNSYYGAMFTYTQSHALIPFDLLGRDHPEDAGYTSAYAVDWWANSVTASKASRQFSIDHMPGTAPTDGNTVHASFGPDSWGISAAFNPVDLGDYKGSLGSPPREINNGKADPDGIIAPYGAISALRLLRTSPNEALSDNTAFRVLRHLYDTSYGTLWGIYGPKESFDDNGNAAEIYVGIDVPLEAMAIEDYRSGITHQWYASSPPVVDGLKILYHVTPPAGDVTLDGTVDARDVVAALRLASGLQKSYHAEVTAGDLTGDGSLTLADAVAIAKRL